MPFDGPAFYDNDSVFDSYMTRRSRADNPNDTLEKPVIVALAGDLTNHRVLDLGCGDASFGRDALCRGCQSYLGIDGSQNMIQAAQQTLAGTNGRAVRAKLEDWDYPVGAFDLVISRLVLHYIDDIVTLFKNIHQTLGDNGRLIFSVEHPVITSSDRAWQGNGPRQDWIVDDYFIRGRRETLWMGAPMVKYHRTIGDYFTGLQQASFIVESLNEAEPQREIFQDDALFQRRQRIPLFLIMAAKKVSR